MLHLRFKKVAAQWRSTGPKDRRPSSTMHDGSNRPPRRGHSRACIIIIMSLLAIVYYLFYVHLYEDDENLIMIASEIKNIDFSKLQTGEVPCVYNCNYDALSRKMKEKILDTFKSNPDGLLPCEVNMLKLDQLQVNTTTIEVSLTRSLYPKVKLGGHYVPQDCQARHKVAIIVPYRDQEEIMNVFIFNIHPFLMNQGLEYRLFIIEQSGNERLNKGRLFNAGFQQASRFGSWSCLVFHDADLLPLDARILYTCPALPTHMSPTVLGRERDLKYQPFGGVVSMIDEHFLNANGYSNNFWGCCGINSDMFLRIQSMGLQVLRYDKNIAKYLPLRHAPIKRNYTNSNRPMPATHKKSHLEDGLTTVRYKVLTIRLRALFTHIIVDVNPSPNEPNIYKHKNWNIQS